MLSITLIAPCTALIIDDVKLALQTLIEYF